MAGESKGIAPSAALQREIDATRRLEALDEERRAVKDQLDRERLMRVTANVIETITAPAFIEKMRQARKDGENGAGLDAAAKLLSLDAMRAAGVDVPGDFRLTSRVFEDRLNNIRVEIRTPAGLGQPGTTLAWGLCAGTGTLSLCYCGGFAA